MIVNYFKDKSLWEKLEKYNTYLMIVSNAFTYRSHNFELKKEEVSDWFYPPKVKYNSVGRSFPNSHEASKNPDFKLYLNLSSYLVVFLLDILYNGKRDVLIEDVGAGDGKLEYYLDKIGFNNFHLIENFQELPIKLLNANLKGIPYKLNDIQNTFPIVVINSGSYSASNDITLRWPPSIELAICYTHENFDCEEFYKRLEYWGYKFLCRDVHNLAIAFAKYDKYEEFMEKLKPYEYK